MKQRNINKLFVLLITNSILVSCGVYQNTSNNDGIYGDEVATSSNKKVVIVNEKQHDDYETNYFLKKLNSLEEIDTKDVFTNVDDYNSVDTIYIDDETIDETLSYNPNQPWGQNSNNDVVVEVNLISNPYWSNFYGNGYYDTWGYRNWGYQGYALIL